MIPVDGKTTVPSLDAGLYLVGTPIGNLEDITLRALRVLSTCDLIAAEDTRRIRKLLNHFQISVKVISYREQNRHSAEPKIIDAVSSGQSVALVSDAGMPCISDPGADLVRVFDRNKMPVFVIPGPSAVSTAVTRCGEPEGKFMFLGFPSHRKGRRTQLFMELRNLGAALVFYEAPHRILTTLRELEKILGDREIRVLRELTKLHEEILAGNITGVVKELENRKEIKGEITVVVSAAEAGPAEEMDSETLEEKYRILLDEGIKPNDALKQLAAESGRKKRDLYSLLKLKK